jgi:hypothetical protein
MGAAGLSAAVSYAETTAARGRAALIAVLERSPENERGGATRYTGSSFRTPHIYRALMLALNTGMRRADMKNLTRWTMRLGTRSVSARFAQNSMVSRLASRGQVSRPSR